MTVAAQMTMKARNAAAALYERQRPTCSDDRECWERVGSMVGARGEWLRKFAKGYAEVKQPGWVVGWNLLALYDSICSRIETTSQKKREIIARREELINEIRQGRDRVDARHDQGCPVEIAPAGRPPVAPAAPRLVITDEDLEPPEFLRR